MPAIIQMMASAKAISVSPVPAVTFNGTPVTNNKSGYTLLTKIPAALLSGVTGTTIRLTLESGGVSCTLNNVTIGLLATSGNAYDVQAATPVTLAGSASWAIAGAAGTQFVSDNISFAIDGSTAVVIGVNMGATASASRARSSLHQGSGAITGIIAYEKAAVQEADDAARGGGYTATNNKCFFIRELAVG